jgi:hypothetical protein
MIEERPNLNTGKAWSDVDVFDIRWQVKRKVPVDEIAEFMCRTEKEIRDKARELGLGELPVVRAARKRTLIRGTRTPISER